MVRVTGPRRRRTVRSSASSSSTFLLAIALLVPAVDRAQEKTPPTVNHDAQLLVDFKARVDQYVALRAKADDSAPPLRKTADSARIKDAQQAVAERIGAARAGAKQGDIFTPEIAAVFRRLIRPEAKDADTKALLSEKKDQPKPGTVPLWKIGMPYPDKEPLATMPPEVLERLPRLPKDIDYRFVAKHLVLHDVRANTIIDFMPNAIP
jgi:hypothetical protein